jgi:flavin-binding protein dodecin
MLGSDAQRPVLSEENTGNDEKRQETSMAESVYKIIELVGSSTDSFEKAATAAVDTAAKSLRDLRVAEVSALDMSLEDGKVTAFRAKVKVSFKYHTE